MRKSNKMAVAAVSAVLLSGVTLAKEAMTPEQLYTKKCGACHKTKDKLVKLDITKEKAVLVDATLKGVGKKMPAFKGKMTDAEVDSVIDYLKPPAK